jgi:hypothetical protein
VIAAFLTLKMLSVEYEVTIECGELTVTTIYGRFYRKLTLSAMLNSISEIGEYSDAAYDAISKLSLQKDFICLSSLSAPDVYYAIFDDEKDRCILYFDVTEKAERELGRTAKSEGGIYHDRIIDIDILLYGREIVKEERLTVPHPLMHKRMFVLQPLAEIAPEALHPILHKSIGQLLEELTECR